MQLEDNNQHTHSDPHEPPPPYTATDYQAVHDVGHLPSPSPVVIQPFKAMSNTPPIFERYPQETVCLSCQQHVVTKLEYRIGVSTWFMCCVVFLVGSFFGCCFLPFCMKEWKDAVHRCPKCNFVIGRKPLI